MLYRAISFLAVLFLALGAGGCRSSKNSQYEEVMMPLQTGSVLQRRVQVPADTTKKSKKKSEKTEKKEKAKEKEKPRKPEAEPSATPAPEEESTPAPERFR